MDKEYYVTLYYAVDVMVRAESNQAAKDLALEQVSINADSNHADVDFQQITVQDHLTSATPDDDD